VQVSARAHEADHFGRRQIPRLRVEDLRSDRLTDLFDEAADYVEVLRRLWDSWEDDAEIRDAATGRFVDRDKLHYINFEGRFFDVKGPSITPRPPQGQPLVTALAHATIPYRLGARSSDVVYVTPHDVEEARTILAEVRAEQEAAGRSGETVHVFADLVVFFDGRDRKARLDEQAGEEYRSDALIFTGSPAELADLLLEWQAAGLSGFRLRPGVLPTDLEAITRGLVPELQQRGVFRRAYEANTLRGLLGLSRPANRYARAES